MRILSKDCQCITIDFQERLMPAIWENQQLLERSQILLAGLSLLEIPNMVTRQYPKGLGDTIEPIRQITEHCLVYDKLAFSCYDDEIIKATVDNNNKKNVILLGIEAHVCVLQTLIDLREAGYNVILVEDCISSRKQSDKEIALKRGAQEGAIITTSEALLFELTRVAGSEKFKGISKLVK